MSKPIKYGIVGAGHLGGYHAQQLYKIEHVNLVGVFDLETEKSDSLAGLYNVAVFDDLKKMFQECDAVSIATPASVHYENVLLALQNDCHVFVEKPFAKSLEEAQDLIALEKQTGLKVQVGHIERFNAAFASYFKNCQNIVFVESHRLCKYNERGLDVDVVLDLMIHDIDLLLYLTPFPVVSVSASGSTILTQSIDMASARIEFKNNFSANLTASRISLKQMRQMRIFEKESYNVLDLQNQTWNQFSMKKNSFQKEKIPVVSKNALYEELNLFINSIYNDLPVVVDTGAALHALRVAFQIQNIIEEKQ